MKIHYEDNHLIVVDKEPNIPTQEDDSKDKDMLTLVKEYIKVKYDKPGNVFAGLVHRLDRPVGGIMVFARTSKAASRLSDQIRRKDFGKSYLAVVMGKVETGRYEDYMYKDRKTNTSYISNKNHPDAKHAILEVISSKYNAQEDMSLVEINLITGRSHQIRVQFSSRNHPLWGDARYNPNSKPGQNIALWSHTLEFKHPTTKEELFFRSPMPNSYPFNVFK